MRIFKLKAIKDNVTFFSVVLMVVISLYAFIPQVLASLSPIDEGQVEKMLREHKSFVKDGNIEGMLSVYHPDFSMEVIHATGRQEIFNKSQISKHQENLKLTASGVFDIRSQQISIVNNNQALVLVAMHQGFLIKDVPVTNIELVHQTMLITKYDGEPKIRKVLSTAIQW